MSLQRLEEFHINVEIPFLLPPLNDDDDDDNDNESHEKTQPNKNSTIKTPAKITEELSQLNENRDAIQDRIQRRKARLGQPLN
jgi:hypothetical protein